jgi:hypothetical protein
LSERLVKQVETNKELQTLLAHELKAIATALGTAAVQEALMIGVKKVGIGVVAHVLLGKLLSGGAGKIVGWMIVGPLIIGFLVHEYTTLPKKFAEKVTPAVMEQIGKNTSKINTSIASEFATKTFETMKSLASNQIEEMRKGLLTVTPVEALKEKGVTQPSCALFDGFLATR